MRQNPKEILAIAEALIKLNRLTFALQPADALWILGQATIATLQRFPAAQREAIQVGFISESVAPFVGQVVTADTPEQMKAAMIVWTTPS